MDEPRAQQIIILCTFITIASTSGAELKGIKKAANLHPSRTIIGGFFAMLACSILAEVAPQAGAYLAVLVSGGAFFTYGLPTIESAGWFGENYTGKKLPKKTVSKVEKGTSRAGVQVLEGLQGSF